MNITWNEFKELVDVALLNQGKDGNIRLCHLEFTDTSNYPIDVHVSNPGRGSEEALQVF